MTQGLRPVTPKVPPARRGRVGLGRFRTLVALLLALGTSALCALACHRGAMGTRPGDASVLRVGHESEIPSLDPATYTEVATWSVLGNIYESLVTFDRDMALTPALAVSWNTPDEHTWIFEIRRDVRFHDGRLLTAADVLFSIERSRSEATSSVKGYLSTIDRMEALDDHTVRIRVTRPDPLLLNRIANVLITPAGYTGLLTHPAGTGPYRFVAWHKDISLDVEAFSDYWRGAPPVRHVHFLPVEDTQKGIDMLRTGGIDVLRWIPESAAASVRAFPHARLVTRAGLAAYYLWFDCRPGPRQSPNAFADRRVRQAISRAIDREELSRRLGGFVAPLNQLVHDSVVGYVADLPPLPFDPEGGRHLMAQTGHAAGLHVTLTHRPQVSLSVVSAALREMLGRIGITVDVETLDWSQMLEAMKGHLPFYLAAWQFDDGDAWTFLRDCLFTRSPGLGYGTFNPGYSNPVVDRLIDDHDRVFDGAKRRQASDTLMRLLNDDAPLVPLYLPQNLYGVSDRVLWKPRIDGSLFAAEMSLR
jgi:peptide/nickel transport system substrate-binding protein